MEYKYAKKENYEDLACGRVIYHRTGMPNFPVRLAQEIFHRSLSYMSKQEDITIYDPCCGGGYLLTVLGLLNMDKISRIYGSDIDMKAVELAVSNLSLITEEGLKQRMQQLEEIYQSFQKQSHLDAIKSAKRILKGVQQQNKKLKTHLFQHDILSGVMNHQFKADLIITDVPYGNLVSWEGEVGGSNFIHQLLDQLIPILNPHSIVAISSDKKQKISHDKYKRLERQRIGKRKFEILTLKFEDL